MQFEPLLAHFLKRCETACVAECCGIDAYDFSPLNIAAYLSSLNQWDGPKEIEGILSQLTVFKAAYGTVGAGTEAKLVNVDEMNQRFTAHQVDELVNEITANISVAMDLIAQSKARAYQNNNRA